MGIAPSPSKPSGALKTNNDVERAMLAKLQDSTLTKDDAESLGLTPFTGPEMASTSLKVLPAHRAGFAIPYFDLDGKETDFYRYRYLEYGTESGFSALIADQKKQLRYAQPPDTVNELYLPPLVDWAGIALDPTIGIVITEGELKAACGCKHGIPTIGLGGVWCFKAVKHNMPILPMFAEFKWTGRRVLICYDSDAVTNPLVIQAENALASTLLELGAQVFIARLDPLKNGKKCGLDDLVFAQGREALVEKLKEAVEWDASRELFKLNEEVVYVSDPGLVLRLDTRQRMSPRAFIDHIYAPRTYMSQEIGAGGAQKFVLRSAPKEWIKWPIRSCVARVTYAPGQPRITENNEFNAWNGWGCHPEPGNVKPWHDLMDYLFDGADNEHKRWFEQWLAYPIQHPGEKLYSAVVVWGVQQGTGKTLVGHTMFRIYGENGTEIGDRDLSSTHNEWAENKQFVVGDEITGGDKRNSADRMKSMITQRLLRLNPKYIPSYTVPDRINYYFTSNHPDAFFLEDTDRRFFIHEVRSKPRENGFYHSYVRWLDEERGAQHLFDYFLNLDLAGFEPQGHAPSTVSKTEMIANGRSDLGSWVAGLREYPDQQLVVGGVARPYSLWTTEELKLMYDPEEKTKVTANGLARELRRAGFNKVNFGMGVYTATKGQQRLWAIRDFEKLNKLGGPKLGELYDKERQANPAKKNKF